MFSTNPPQKVKLFARGVNSSQAIRPTPRTKKAAPPRRGRRRELVTRFAELSALAAPAARLAECSAFVAQAADAAAVRRALEARETRGGGVPQTGAGGIEALGVVFAERTGGELTT